MEEKQLLERKKILQTEYREDLNEGHKFIEYSYGSNKKVFWQCPSGHVYDATIKNRYNNRNCPYCAGKKVIVGETDFATLYPDIAKDWDFEKNGDLTPNEISPFSNKKVFWICENGHSYDMVIAKRTGKKYGCPYCSNHRLVSGENDLATLCPNIAKEWDFEKNGDLTPDMVFSSSSKIVYWKCENGHSWQASINNRQGGKGCPFCNGVKVISGENDLATLYPDIAKDWDFDKNGNLTPNEIFPYNNTPVYWKCCNGHSWKASSRSRLRHGCPICVNERQTSFPEFAIGYYLKKIDKNIIHTYKELGFEIDVYIPSKKIGIEYDGSFYHENKKDSDLKKNKLCRENNISLYRIRENLPKLRSSSKDIVYHKDSELNNAIHDLIFDIYGKDIDVDVDRDRQKIEKNRYIADKENSLAILYPEVAKDWDFEKNGDLKPSQVSKGSNRKVFWKCQCGHSWRTTVSHRTTPSHQTGCPACARKRITV